jgi:hypothetical protein
VGGAQHRRSALVLRKEGRGAGPGHRHLWRGGRRADLRAPHQLPDSDLRMEGHFFIARDSLRDGRRGGNVRSQIGPQRLAGHGRRPRNRGAAYRGSHPRREPALCFMGLCSPGFRRRRRHIRFPGHLRAHGSLRHRRGHFAIRRRSGTRSHGRVFHPRKAFGRSFIRPAGLAPAAIRWSSCLFSSC